MDQFSRDLEERRNEAIVETRLVVSALAMAAAIVAAVRRWRIACALVVYPTSYLPPCISSPRKRPRCKQISQKHEPGPAARLTIKCYRMRATNAAIDRGDK